MPQELKKWEGYGWRTYRPGDHIYGYSWGMPPRTIIVVWSLDAPPRIPFEPILGEI